MAIDAQFGGVSCDNANNTREQQFCNEHPCPIDAVCDWSEWSACAATCGNGTRERMWVEIAPAQFGGLSCTAAGPESTGRRLQSSGTMNSTAYATVALNGTHHLAWDGDIVEHVNEMHHIAHGMDMDTATMSVTTMSHEQHNLTFIPGGPAGTVAINQTHHTTFTGDVIEVLNSSHHIGSDRLPMSQSCRGEPDARVPRPGG